MATSNNFKKYTNEVKFCAKYDNFSQKLPKEIKKNNNKDIKANKKKGKKNDKKELGYESDDKNFDWKKNENEKFENRVECRDESYSSLHCVAKLSKAKLGKKSGIRKSPLCFMESNCFSVYWIGLDWIG